MANELGITQSTYSRMEIGESEVSYSKLEKISSMFGMKPEEVISFNENMVFNIMHNDVGNGFVINNNQLSEGEKNLYERQIELLKEEVSYLKGLLSKVMK